MRSSLMSHCTFTSFLESQYGILIYFNNSYTLKATIVQRRGSTSEVRQAIRKQGGKESVVKEMPCTTGALCPRHRETSRSFCKEQVRPHAGRTHCLLNEGCTFFEEGLLLLRRFCLLENLIFGPDSLI